MAEFTKSEQALTSIPIDFSDTMLKESVHFDYADNPLYNLSVPLLSIILTLSRLPKPDNIEQFRQHLKREVVVLSEAGKGHDYPAAVIDKLCCLHCIVIDEFIIHGRWGADAGWENNTLLSELFSMKNGGELFFTVAEKAMLQAAKMTDLLELIYVLLQMGFKGRYRSRQTDLLALIIKDIAATIPEKITAPNILIEDIPQVKFRSLRSGVHYFSLTLLIFLVLGLATAFIDYWYEQSYSLRAASFIDLDQVTARYVLNAKSDDIIYVSTHEDIHAIHKLTQTKEETTKNTDLPVIAKPKISAKPEHEPEHEHEKTQARITAYRVQLASFSNEKNAQKYLKGFADSDYPVSVMAIGKYFILYSNAATAQAVKQQQIYFKKEYQLAVIVVATEPAGQAL